MRGGARKAGAPVTKVVLVHKLEHESHCLIVVASHGGVERRLALVVVRAEVLGGLGALAQQLAQLVCVARLDRRVKRRTTHWRLLRDTKA